jgi:predicted ribosome quality control (RQC) complex YloA/Tae2 family protein
LDGISLYAIRHEIAGYLPLRVQKVYHPSEKELVLALWSNKSKLYLVLSLEYARPFVGVANNKPDTPKVPSGVCLGLRKRLEGGTLTGIRQESLDRILYFDFSGHDELGNSADYTLVLDAAGGKGGMALISGDTIELSVTSSQHRTKTGSPYLPPESSKHNLLEGPDPDTLAHQICSSGMPALMALMSHIEGIGKEHAAGMLSRAGLPGRKPLTRENAQEVAQVIREVKERLVSGEYSPALYLRRSGEPLMGVLPLHHLEPERTYGSVLDAASEFREYFLHFMGFRSLETQVRSMHSRIAAKLKARLEAQEHDFEKASEYDKYRIWGELIHATGRDLPRGHNEMRVLDYYQDPPREITVPLDPRYSSRENARRYYAKYSKLQRTAKVLQASLKQLRAQRDSLEHVRQRLDQADDTDTLLSLQEELVEIAQAANIRIHKRKREISRPVAGEDRISRKRSKKVETLTGPDGAVAYVGLSSSANDYLVRRLRRPGDIWLHAKGVRGAHVLLRPAAGKPITDEALNWAASLAAIHSEAASSGRVEVDWVDAGAIRKPGGSPPGFVTYRGAKTILVKIGEHDG